MRPLSWWLLLAAILTLWLAQSRNPFDALAVALALLGLLKGAVDFGRAEDLRGRVTSVGETLGGLAILFGTPEARQAMGAVLASGLGLATGGLALLAFMAVPLLRPPRTEPTGGSESGYGS